MIKILFNQIFCYFSCIYTMTNNVVILVVLVIFGLPTLINGGSTFELYSDNPDIFRNTSELIESRGFQSETHRMITEDGYILTMFRLINPYMKHKRPLQPILIQHGLCGNGDYFIFSDHEALIEGGQFLDLKTLRSLNCTGLDRNSAGTSIAYILASCGYDVWLGW